tara:strand:+ start:650 stop:1039 length:390 start_codon:yes stop_codon:yes gene_type:complete
MKNFKKLSRIVFYLANFFLIVLYVYPGSFLGCYFYNDCNFDPQIIEDYLISFNHFFAFCVLTVLGLLAFSNTSKTRILIFYLLFISVILELLHFFIPIRSFQISDLVGNILGVIVIIILYFFKNEIFQK